MVIEATIPPALSKACGKFKSPAPRVAFTIKNIVPKTLDPVIENIDINIFFWRKIFVNDKKNNHN